MRMQGNRMPGQNARTDDAYLLVLKQDCMIVPRQPARPAIRATGLFCSELAENFRTRHRFSRHIL
jgi:hypothetical protein